MPLSFLAIVLTLLAFPVAAAASGGAASDALHTINNPDGGQVVYGTLRGQSSISSAMVFMLRQVHGHFGERPRIGKFFQSRGSNSTAVFFNVTGRNQGNKSLAGVVIVSMPPGGTSTAAVLYDDAARFSTAEPAMMKALNAAWHAASIGRVSESRGSGSGGHPSREAAPLPLRNATAGDRSASIGLAPGWRLTGVSGGALTAEGPNGEQIGIGIMFQGIRDPRYMQSQGYGANGQRPLACPYGGDVFEAYICVINQVRQNRGMPQVSFRLTSSQSLQANQQEQVIQALFEMDLHDGKGPRKASARIGELHFANMPSWALTLSGSNAPEPVFDSVNPTIMAMVHSYSQDARVINRENAAVINNIHAISAASTAQAHAADQRREASSAAFNNHMQAIDQNSGNFNSHMDDIDRSSKAFQDYTLDRSVVRDNDYSERGTVSNSYADSLVRANPDRFQIIQNQNLIRGLDY
jgi:hypothetical protein